MAIQSQHLTGFAVGLGAAALGFYLYKQNQPEVDAFLRKHGIEMPGPCGLDAANLTLEQLVAEKERLEDRIAEREYAAGQTATEATTAEDDAPQSSTPRRKRAPAKQA